MPKEGKKMKCCGKASPPGAKPWQSHKSEDMYGHREAACSGYMQALSDQHGTVLLTGRATNTFFWDATSFLFVSDNLSVKYMFCVHR